ncbi:MAG TPA: exodeoxyribonuclease VII large subunit [Prochlorococcaceae cyanobacterium Fu_MAG_50]|nr:exodeoxyribonuclease VII large subunit [Prochlorococcaceae cyanobacterium Fu_MAG_50]
MNAESLPQFTVRDLNATIGNLLERGFAPRFLVQASVSKPQLKKGHLWMTLTDGEVSITAVAWASTLRQLSYRPDDGDGVTIVGKLNFWAARANLAVQVLDMRPSLTTVLRQFESVRALLERDGVIDEHRKRPLPAYPGCIGILTSVPSSALADMLRTARERWPTTRLLIIPIPVQGAVAARIQEVLSRLADLHQELNLDAIVVARGGGSREDLMVFDDEQLCRDLAIFPIPVVTGLGHEDDLTVADLVADHRSATPTAAIVSLLPSRETAMSHLLQRRRRLDDHRRWLITREQQRLAERRSRWRTLAPILQIQRQRLQLKQRQALLLALSPSRWLKRGFAIVHDNQGKTIRSISGLNRGTMLNIHLCDGEINAITESIQPGKVLQ